MYAYSNRLQIQAFEESEPEDGIAALDLAYKHVFVMHLENLNDEICVQDHQQARPRFSTGENALKIN